MPEARAVAPTFATTTIAAADHPVGHWMAVMNPWKQELGSAWAKTCGATTRSR